MDAKPKMDGVDVACLSVCDWRAAMGLGWIGDGRVEGRRL